MPTVREALLDAALSALDAQPWVAVRMVDVAVAAGVSRQTLYNEFGSKEGLARALARRETDDFLAGVERALAAAEHRGDDAGDSFAAATAWTLHTARHNALVRAALTGCRSDRLPDLAPDPAPRAYYRPRIEESAPSPRALVAEFRTRAAGAFEHTHPKLDPADLGRACEAAVRLTLSYVIAPAASDNDACQQVARLVRGLLARGF
ncbi:TetR family transcriptional regulator [Actinacidiphila oryziradicis]|jgi:AcrR family transcriptional regulator|uniref:TetR family transcriptional regulator n=1 Tax=Actinacidiphila oryziradicis TaxID=2571141 RepID=UPI0023EFEF30|nr:TetR family transcriptional regulator [Actinacidiphila oryziradicis]MCW2870969.1 TetR family transcriptional regulator [Actinacidiphila oryziradicis]